MALLKTLDPDFAPIIKCAPRSTAPRRACRRSPAAARCESRWHVDAARLASRRCACAPIRACAHAQQHPALFHTIGNKLQHSHLHHCGVSSCSLQARAMQKCHTPCASLFRLQNACHCPTHAPLFAPLNAHHLPLQSSQVCDRAHPGNLIVVSQRRRRGRPWQSSSVRSPSNAASASAPPRSPIAEASPERDAASSASEE